MRPLRGKAGSAIGPGAANEAGAVATTMGSGGVGVSSGGCGSGAFDSSSAAAFGAVPGSVTFGMSGLTGTRAMRSRFATGGGSAGVARTGSRMSTMRTASGGMSSGPRGSSSRPNAMIAACAAIEMAAASASARQRFGVSDSVTLVETLDDLLEAHVVFLDDQHLDWKVVMRR
jgi:hypothetical protein